MSHQHDSEPHSPVPHSKIDQEANSDMQGGQQAAIGNNNIQLQVSGNVINILGAQREHISERSRSEDERLLLHQVKNEIASRLKQSLHNAIPISLSKEEQPKQVKRPWDAEIKSPSKPSELLDDETTLLEVFDREDIGGKLLILGEPGSGKTTTMLNLAKVLVERAEKQINFLIPVLCNLSSWKDDKQSMHDWLVTELKSKYGVHQNIAKRWLEEKKLLPMLDGLDELEPQRQELCVHAINQLIIYFGKTVQLVICSRSEEYSNAKTKLELNGAICLQPLSDNQIKDYLTQINHIKLWHIIHQYSDLLLLARIPLLLNIMIFAYPKFSPQKWQKLNSAKEHLSYLLDLYIQEMLSRPINNNYYHRQTVPSERQTKLWLIWLARKLKKRAQSEFLVEDMQPTWLQSKHQKKLYSYGLLLSLLPGELCFLLVPLFVWVTHKLVLGIFATIPLVVLCLLFNVLAVYDIWKNNSLELVRHHDTFDWSWKKGKTFVITTPIVGLIGLVSALLMKPLYTCKCLPEWLISDSYASIIGQLSTLSLSLGITAYSLALWALITLRTGLTPRAIEEKKFPNQSIHKMAKSSTRAAIVAVLVTCLFSPLFFLTNGSLGGLFGVIISSLFLGYINYLVYGGWECNKHFILRLILRLNGYTPWDYARFLNYCTERMLLQRVGGHYRFIHDLLRDHFAIRVSI